MTIEFRHHNIYAYIISYNEKNIPVCCKQARHISTKYHQNRSTLDLVIVKITRSRAVARIADRTAKNCRGHVTQGTPTFREIYLCACSALPIQRHVSNLKYLAQVVLKICSIVCQKLQGSRELRHAHCQGNYLCACSAFLYKTAYQI